MNLELFLLLATALFCIGLFGALTQQSVVMLMMGLELMLGGVIVARSGSLALHRASRRRGSRYWWFWPSQPWPWRWRSGSRWSPPCSGLAKST
ncbi:NAD(P)H-quinone oxidoreductase subunit 4L, chloroplastic [Streptomyces microflavus]